MKPGRGPGRIWLLVACVSAWTWSALRAAPAVETGAGSVWDTRLPAFRTDAPEDAPPMLLYFTAPWCGYCRQMDDTTLREPSVVAAVRAYRAHKVDHDSQGGVVARFGVRGIPAFVLATGRGELVDKLTGATDAATFVAWLENARGRLDGKRRADARASLDLRRALLLAESSEPGLPDLGVAWLMHAAVRGNAEQQARAGLVLESVYAARPALLAPALASDDLAVRVSAANHLAKVGAGNLRFDPWAEAPRRAQAAAEIGAALGWQPPSDGAVSVAEVVAAMESGARLRVRFVEMRKPADGRASPVAWPAHRSVWSDKEEAAFLGLLQESGITAPGESQSGELALGAPRSFVDSREVAGLPESEVTITVGGSAQKFTTRNVGCEAALTLLGGGDGYVRLKAALRHARFKGFVEHGDKVVELGNGKQVQVPAGFYQPIFETQEREEHVRLGAGETLVLRLDVDASGPADASPLIPLDARVADMSRSDFAADSAGFLVLIRLEP